MTQEPLGYKGLRGLLVPQDLASQVHLGPKVNKAYRDPSEMWERRGKRVMAACRVWTCQDLGGRRVTLGSPVYQVLKVFQEEWVLLGEMGFQARKAPRGRWG